MSNQNAAQVTPADIQSAGEKLEQFRRGLPPGEQAVLAWLIQRAAMSAATASPAAGYAIIFNQDSAGEGLPFRFETTWSLGSAPTPESRGEAG